MKKLTALLLAFCLMLLCGCTSANKAELAAAKESGAAGVWYCNLFGHIAELTLNNDLSCTMEIEGDSYDYKGTWTVSGSELTIRFTASNGSWQSQTYMSEWTFSITADALTSTIYGAEELLTFTRELPPMIEIAPLRSDAVYEDFIGVWNVELIYANGFFMAAGDTPIPPAEMGMDMRVSIGTQSATVETSAQPDTVYIFPTAFANGTLTLTLVDGMFMTAQLHEDGMMSLSGITPLHKSMFSEDVPLILYLRTETEDLD